MTNHSASALIAGLLAIGVLPTAHANSDTQGEGLMLPMHHLESTPQQSTSTPHSSTAPTARSNPAPVRPTKASPAPQPFPPQGAQSTSAQQTKAPPAPQPSTTTATKTQSNSSTTATAVPPNSNPTEEEIARIMRDVQPREAAQLGNMPNAAALERASRDGTQRSRTPAAPPVNDPSLRDAVRELESALGQIPSGNDPNVRVLKGDVSVDTRGR